ncbi:MAG TPA: DoxX-like family protein [Phycisphaerae bacterium]
MSESVPSRRLLLVGRFAIALVWLYHGLWCKLLGRSITQAAVVAGVPFLGANASRIALMVIGAGEVVLAGWLLSGWRSRAAALVQTLAIVAMNAGGLLWSRQAIHDPVGLVVQNLVLICLIWCVADQSCERKRADAECA